VTENAKRHAFLEIIRTSRRAPDVEWMVIQAKRDAPMRAKLLAGGSEGAIHDRRLTGIIVTGIAEIKIELTAFA
jgi:hypothetical protein